jgi:hypothetical protein
MAGLAFTLIIDGKFSWLARLVREWPSASWSAGVVTLAALGAVSGIAQSLVLRKHVCRAGYWILLSTLGWAAGAMLSGVQNSFWSTSAAWDIPVLVTGIGLLWLRRDSLADMQTTPRYPLNGVNRSAVHMA